MKYMNLSEIKIKNSFMNSIPKEDKMEECRRFWNRHHAQDRYIVVNRDNVLIDGYIQYLVLKENGAKEAAIQLSNKEDMESFENNMSYRNMETTYIFGIHENSRSTKERVWRIPPSWPPDRANKLSIGDILLVKAKRRLALIKVTRIERSNKCPVDIPVKTVVKKIKDSEVL